MYVFDELRGVVAKLRSEEGCLQNREQTLRSLKKYLADEMEEVFETVDSKDMENLYEELEDMLLQVVLNSEITGEQGSFTIDDVIGGICRKVVRRYPHVFGNVKINPAGEGVVLWNQIRMREKAKKS